MGVRGYLDAAAEGGGRAALEEEVPVDHGAQRVVGSAVLEGHVERLDRICRHLHARLSPAAQKRADLNDIRIQMIKITLKYSHDLISKTFRGPQRREDRLIGGDHAGLCLFSETLVNPKPQTLNPTHTVREKAGTHWMKVKRSMTLTELTKVMVMVNLRVRFLPSSWTSNCRRPPLLSAKRQRKRRETRTADSSDDG